VADWSAITYRCYCWHCFSGTSRRKASGSVPLVTSDRLCRRVPGIDKSDRRTVDPWFPCLFTSTIVEMLRGARPRGHRMVCALCAWQVVEFASIRPTGIAWLDDSNVDWGQGLVQLRDYLDTNLVEHCHLCYFGNLDPGLYGIRGRLTWHDFLLAPPSPGTWILSSFCVARLQAHLESLFGQGPLNWLRYVEPKSIVGHDIRPGDLVGEAPVGKEHPVFPPFPEP
jgi:hypothetical protein